MALDTTFGPKSATTGSYVRRTFWGLLVAISLLTLFLTGLVVWFTARPVLEEYQAANLELSATHHAQELRARFEQDQRILEFLAAQPDVVSLVIGNTESREVLQRYSFETQLTSLVTSVALFDAFGELLEARELGSTASSSDFWELSGQVRDTVNQREITHKLLTSRSGNIPSAHAFAMCVPVSNQGFAEGALCALQTLQLASFEVASGLGRASEIVDTGASSYAFSERDLAIPIGIGGLSLLITQDLELADKVGSEILFRILVAVTAILAFAKGILAIYGDSVIVKPHLDLLKQQRELSELAAIAMRANDAILLTDLEEKIVWCNPAYEMLTGYSLDEIRGRNPADLLNGPETEQDSIDKIKRTIESKSGEKIETINYSKSGRKYWASVSITPLFDPRGIPYGYMSITNDVTARRQQTEALVAAQAETLYIAEHDVLTGLPNRRFFEKELSRRSADLPSQGGLIHIDLDGFKGVNDTLGHDAGDHVLKRVGEILASETRSPTKDRPGDVAVRLGGDEFLILAAGARQPQDAIALCRRIKARLEEPMSLSDRLIDISASFGIALPGPLCSDQNELISAADAAMYEAKSLGRGEIYVYDDPLDKKVRRKRVLADAIRVGLSEDEFEPYYQLQFDAKTRQIVGAEVLARWNSSSLGMVPPYEFLPLLEELSLIGELDRVIFQAAISGLAHLRCGGDAFPRLSFNVTGDRLLTGKVFEFFSRQVVENTKFSIEVLESITIEGRAEEFRREVDRLRDIGIGIEIDDFGSGHASVSGVVALQPDTIKIDRSLVARIDEDVSSRRIFAQLVKMGQLMGVTVTAEGVESDAHAKVATNLGCDTLQGFGLAVPLPLKELKALLGNRPSIVGEVLGQEELSELPANNLTVTKSTI